MINPTGKKLTREGTLKRIQQKLRENFKVKVDTQTDEVKPDLKVTDKLKELINSYHGLVFNDAKVGCMKLPLVHLEYVKDFKLKQLPFRNVPIHYQSEVSKLLDFLRKEGVITCDSVDHRGNHNCVMNVVIVDQKSGHIRMNIENTPRENTPRNTSMRRTKYHVQNHKKFATNSKKQQCLVRSTWDGLFINCY